jgi:hypothetical protein
VTVGVVDLLLEERGLRDAAGPQLEPEVAHVLVGVDVPAEVDAIPFPVMAGVNMK